MLLPFLNKRNSMTKKARIKIKVIAIVNLHGKINH